MASEREALSRSSVMEEEVSSLKKKVSHLEDDCRNLKDELKEKGEENQELLRAVDAGRERAERAEQREKERQRGPDAETIRKMKVSGFSSFQF